MPARREASLKTEPTLQAAPRRSRWLWALLLACLVAAAFLYPRWRDERDVTQLAGLVAQARLQEAEEFLDVHPQLASRNARAAYLAATIFRRRERPGPYTTHLQTAERLGWPRAEIELQGLLVRVQSGEEMEPAALMQKLGSGITDEQQEEVFDALTRSQLRTFQVDSALEFIGRWQNIRPQSLAARLHQARAWQLSEGLDRSTKALEEVLKTCPGHYEATVELATLLLIQNDLPRTQALLTALLTEHHGDPRASLLLAQCERRAGSVSQARERLEQLAADAALPAEQAAIAKLLGQLRFDADDFPGAVTALQQAIQLNPRDPEAHQSLAAALAATGDAEGAETQRKEVQRLQGAQEKLLRALRAMRASPDDPEVRLRHAEALRDAVSAEAASGVLRLLLAAHPDHAGAKKLWEELQAQHGSKP